MSHTVTIEPIGEQIEVEEGQTILAAALRQGVWLPFACGHGTCATCKVQVLEGDVEIGDASPFALMDVERGEGKVLACCATVESDVTIEADIDVEQFRAESFRPGGRDHLQVDARMCFLKRTQPRDHPELAEAVEAAEANRLTVALAKDRDGGNRKI